MAITVAFTDTSTPGGSGPITAWNWHFGDGGSSTAENPTHDYDDSYAGRHVSVRLTVTGTAPDGTASITKSVPIPV